jgi:hypothetical protein
MEILGAHAIGLVVAAELLEQNTSGGQLDADDYLTMIMQNAKARYDSMSPDEIDHACARVARALIESSPDEYDPVMLFDPVTGPVRDSELRRICEEAARNQQSIKWDGSSGTVQPPDEPQ